ncbi:Nucleoside-diphosphate-sugar epimerase [Micromonospora pallida]|uniref:UDP-glucose 4-epimerase n=1 Tax=Micromonospora pallida TaxID=145854 RepID=A0A1C6TD44_9ACTN|nr:NAD-dependent epimerase/dehydratase family protein [Micromonospora pallida]SCL39736.1 Nucleoside-diphosphate-sugar epimerase [Micromonospora pallida]
MRVVVLGGTEFIGRRVVERLVERGDEVVVVHRGRTEPDDLPRCAHLHVDRRDFAEVADRVRGFGPDAVVDSYALTRADADAVLPHLPDVPLVLLSSVDVYRAWELLLADDDTPLPVPLTENAPLRQGRRPYQGRGVGLDDYDKLDVEPAYLARGGSVLRLGMVYGRHDQQRREEFVLRRVRAGRTRIPVGAGDALLTRLHVDDAASAVLAALDQPAAASGEVFNLGESVTYPVRGWLRLILNAAGHDAELVRVPDERVPEDLWLTRRLAQHVLVDNGKALRALGWQPTDPTTAVARSVRWHLDHPPTDASADFSADDQALAG